MADSAHEPGLAALPVELLQALVAHSREMLAVSDGTGTLSWANARFSAATGYSGRAATSLLDFTIPGAAGSEARLSFARMLSSSAPDRGVVQLRGPAGEAFWADVHSARAAGRIVWTFVDVTRSRSLAARAARLDELLDTAQEFGRLGIWEREIPSGEGRWDRHVFGFWGIDPAEATPNYSDAIQRIHPEDRARMIYADSTRRAGRYSQRYRVIQPDGSTRWIHSQWEVKNGPRGTPDRALGVMMDDTEAFDAARTLSDVNAQLKLAVDLGKIASWRHDLRTGRMHYSDLAFELLGMAPRPEGLSIDEVRALIHPDDIPLVLASAEKALASREPTDMEARYRRSDGSWRYILTRRVAERDNAGVPIAFVGVALDITDRVEHLRHVEELARRLDAASRAAGIGIWTTTAGPGGADWNAQMFELFDRCAPPRPPSFGQWLRESVHADDRTRVGHDVHGYFVTGEGPFDIEFRALRKDGSVRWVVMRADIDRAQPGTRRVLGVAMDVTEHHRALDALREASQRAALITRHAGIGTWDVDAAGGEHWDAQMFQLRGLEPREQALTREERLAITHPDDVPIVIDSLDESAAALPAAYQFRVRLPDGSHRWLASRSAAVLDENGKPVRRVGVNWDVTESKNAERVREQAALAEREIQAKSQFLSRMSHELRTPLNAVLGFTQLLQIEARHSGQASQLAKLEHVRAAGDHLLSLINDVLDLSGLEAGEIRLSMQSVELGELVRQSLPLLHSLAAQHGVTLETGRTEGAVRADPTRLRQVLINLLSNAIKYNRTGGKVLVESEALDGEAMLSVRDTGRGLRAEQVASLFEPFNRFGVESEGIEGTGIGLTIVKALVEGMHGRIEVASAPGEGTVFRVLLPAASVTLGEPAPERSLERATAEPVPPAGDTAQRCGTVLYIEDNPVNVLLVEELVKSLGGLTIVSEPSGAAGIERASALLPDLVLVDLQLPDFDGYEVLRRLRADARTGSIPCVALSANAMREDIERGLASGFADYLTKPIDFAVFVAALHRLLPAFDTEAVAADAPAEHAPGD